MSDKQSTDATSGQVKHTAGAFDVRTFIAALMGIFGVILLAAGIFGDERTTTGAPSPGNVNVWVGLALLVFAGIMQGWAMLRPTIVDEAELAKQKSESEEMGGHSAH